MDKEFEQELLSYIPQGEEEIKTVLSSMEYSLSAGGKRIRPFLTLAFAELCGGSKENAMPFACAVEMVHTYSLIHDDLPCMDNDDLRRGKPTNHKVFGEAAALLGGDGLLTLAFETVLSDKAVSMNGYEKCVRAGRALAEYAGAVGMIGGQIIDLESEGKQIELVRLQMMDEKKTGALIAAACIMGCISAGAGELQIQAAKEYAMNIGTAFQIVDDMLDVTSDTATLGKPVGSDKENDKSTYVSILGLDECKRISRELTEKAVQSLENFEGDTSRLKELAYYLCDRKN